MQTAPASTALLSDPAQAFLALAVVVCAIVWLSGQPVGRRLFSVLPTPLWIFVLPMALTTAGVLPQSSEAYEVMAVVLVPTSLFLLAASSDFRSTLRTGPLAVLILAAGTLGVCAGGIASFALTGDALGEEGWKGFAVLSGAWIGGSANAIAVQQGLDADPSVIGPLLVTETLVAYLWVTLLLFLSGRQAAVGRFFHSRPLALTPLSDLSAEDRPAVSASGLSGVFGSALVAAGLAAGVAAALPEVGDPTVISTTTWTVLLVVALGVAASFTPVRNIERHGASQIGLWLIYLLLASLGARGEFSAFLSTPVYIAAGLIWLGVHAVILLLAARILRAPPALIALGSVANIGGFVTAPIVATAYDRRLVPTALLMAAMAQIAGIYLPFLLAAIMAGM